ncbi:MAG: DUF1272 domain-containing protein [Gemmatimonadota bacterium]
MRPVCESCSVLLDQQDLAFICSFECTFCPGCTVKVNKQCPNCGGELLRRPTRGPR